MDMNGCMNLLAALLLLLAPLAGHSHVQEHKGGESLQVRVTWVYDGDTIQVVLPGGQKERLRLLGIDAPEHHQAWSARSRERLRALTLGKTVSARLVERDLYGRWLATLFLPTGGEVNLMLVQEGLAWHYRHYFPDSRYARAQKDAQRGRLGLWRDPAPTPPWIWRRNHPRS